MRQVELGEVNQLTDAIRDVSRDLILVEVELKEIGQRAQFLRDAAAELILVQV